MSYLIVMRALRGYCNLKYAIGQYTYFEGKNPFRTIKHIDENRVYELDLFYENLALEFN